MTKKSFSGRISKYAHIKISKAHHELLAVELGTRFESLMSEWFLHFMEYLKTRQVTVPEKGFYGNYHAFRKTYQISENTKVIFIANVWNDEIQRIVCQIKGLQGSSYQKLDEFRQKCENKLLEDSILKGN